MKKINYITGFICFMMLSQAFGRTSYSDDVFDQINNSLAFGMTGTYLDYAERITDNSPTYPDWANDTVRGVIPGFNFNIRSDFFRKIYTDFYADLSVGKLTYDGAYQDPPHNPYVYDNSHVVINTDVKLGYIFIDGQSVQVIPYIGVGYHFWDRGLNDPMNREKYQNFNAIFGVKLNCAVTDDLFISPYVNAGKTFGAKMKKVLSGRDYDLGSKPIYQTGLEMNYRLHDDLFLTGFANYTHFQYGKSQVVSGFFEPDSRTNEIKVGVGIRYTWSH